MKVTLSRPAKEAPAAGPQARKHAAKAPRRSFLAGQPEAGDLAAAAPRFGSETGRRLIEVPPSPPGARASPWGDAFPSPTAEVPAFGAGLPGALAARAARTAWLLGVTPGAVEFRAGAPPGTNGAVEHLPHGDRVYLAAHASPQTLAHELAHVAQRQHHGLASTERAHSHPEDAAEADARRAALHALAGRSYSVAEAPRARLAADVAEPQEADGWQRRAVLVADRIVATGLSLAEAQVRAGLLGALCAVTRVGDTWSIATLRSRTIPSSSVSSRPFRRPGPTCTSSRPGWGSR